MHPHSSLEALESRIAPAGIVHTYTDVDGDLVTVRVSKGNPGDALFTEVAAGALASGRQLQKIDLQGRPVFDGATITVTARPQDVDGDGRRDGDGLANVGFIDAYTAGAIRLAAVSIGGDLGKILAGDGGFVPPGVGALKVVSLGALGLNTGAPDLNSEIRGHLGSLYVRGDVGGSLQGTETIGSVTIGGSLGFGSVAPEIYSQGAMGPVRVAGWVIGTIASNHATLGPVTIGGSMFGTLYSAENMGLVRIAGDLGGFVYSDDGGLRGMIVGGSMVFGGRISFPENIGVVRVGRDMVDSFISSQAEIAGVIVGGSLLRTADLTAISAGGNLGWVKIGGSVLGASISSGAELDGVTIGGALRPTDAGLGGRVLSVGNLGPVSIGGDVAGTIESTTGRLASVKIGGSLASGLIRSEGRLGPVWIAGDVRGTDAETGLIQTNGRLDSVTIRGSVFGGTGVDSGRISSGGDMGPVRIGGDLIGGSGDSTGFISSAARLAGVVIGGSVLSGLYFPGGNDSGEIFSTGNMGAVRIGGDLRGASLGVGLPPLDRTGYLQGARIASVWIGGSILAGFDDAGAGGLTNSGAIRALHDLGPITVRGDLLGNASQHMLITARGQLQPGATTDLALRSLTVGGRVEYADILAGYDTAITPTGVNADAQIGSVVAGTWIASNLVAGVQDNADAPRDADFGDGDDVKIAGGTDRIGVVSKIASILIRHQALGTSASVSSTDHFGIVAQQLGSFAIGPTRFPLQPGPASVADLTGLAVGVTADLRLREVAL